PVERHEVMGAQRVERDVLLDDHRRVALVVGEEGDVRLGAFGKPPEQVDVHPGDPLRSLREVGIGEVEAQDLDDRAHVLRHGADAVFLGEGGWKRRREGLAHDALAALSRSPGMSRATGTSLVTTSLTFPSLPMMKAVRAENPLSSFQAPYFLETSPLGWKSASSGKVMPFCGANALCAHSESTEIPRTCRSSFPPAGRSSPHCFVSFEHVGEKSRG